MIFLLQTSSSGLEEKPIVAIVEIMCWVLGMLNWSDIDKAFLWRNVCKKKKKQCQNGIDSATGKTRVSFVDRHMNTKYSQNEDL